MSSDSDEALYEEHCKLFGWDPRDRLFEPRGVRVWLERKGYAGPAPAAAWLARFVTRLMVMAKTNALKDAQTKGIAPLLVRYTWGCPRTNGHLKSVSTTLRKLIDAEEDANTHAYEVFGGGWELLPVFAVVPMFLLEERETHWGVFPFGMLRKLGVCMSQATFKYLDDPPKRDVLTMDEFYGLFEQISKNKQGDVYYQGVEYAAFRILLKQLLNTPGGFEKYYRLRKHLHILAEADAQKVRDNLKKTPSLFICDLGDEVCMDLNSDKKKPIKTFQIEHGRDVTVGIGFSLQALPSLLERIDHLSRLTREIVDFALDEKIDFGQQGIEIQRDYVDILKSFQTVRLLTGKSTLDAEGLLGALRVAWPTPETSNLYVLGSMEVRKTFHAQQVRALQLIWALHQKQILRPGARLAIVGGGLSGVTAAWAASRLHYSVDLYEKEDVLELQMSARHRYIHPHIYDWPVDGSLKDEASLPEWMRWEAGFANAVIKQTRDKWENHRVAMKHCTNHPKEAEHRLNVIRREVTERDADSPDAPMSIETLLKHNTAVVLAVGFGLEVMAEHEAGYWDWDSLQDEFTEQKTILVSGNGDGALIDLGRAAIDDFDQGRAIYAVAQELIDRGQKLLDIEGEVRNPAELFSRYERLLDKDTIDRIRLTPRKNATVTFHYRDVPFSPTSAIINRILAFIMIKKGFVKEWRGEGARSRSADGRNVVTVAGESRSFDIVVQRWGKRKGGLDAFPEIEKLSRAQRDRFKPLGDITGIIDQSLLDFWSKT